MSLYDTLYQNLADGNSPEEIIKILAMAQQALSEERDMHLWGDREDYDLDMCIEDLAVSMINFELALGAMNKRSATPEFERVLKELHAFAENAARVQSKTSKVHDNDKEVDDLKAFIDSLD